MPNLLGSNRCITIDRAAAPPDNGALACIRVAFPQHHDNSTNAEAIGNLTQSTATETIAQIVGHGDEGQIATGGGQSPSYHHDVIYLWGRPGDELDVIFAPITGRFSAIELLGCDTGTEEAGSLLVWTIANIAKCTVMAPAGLVFCRGGVVSLQAGATWQVASPSMQAPPDIIHAPKLPFALNYSEMPIFKILINGVVVEVSSEMVRLITIEFFGLHPGTTRIDKISSRHFLPLLGLDKPARTQSRLLALVTAKISVEFIQSNDGKTLVKTFNVYNDRVLQDLEEPNILYSAHPTLKAALDGMRPL